MIDTIYFFASKEDICNIFHKIEQEFDIKYCLTRADKKVGEKGIPRMEFDTIEEIADDCHAVHLIQPFYLLTPKTEVMKRYRLALKDQDDIERYRMDYTENRNSVLLKGMRKHEDLTFDYYAHIDRKIETEFSALLFKRIVREVKRNCVRIKYSTPVYIGKEMYKNKKKLVFSGERCGCITVTEADEAKEWYRNPKVRAFGDKPFVEQLSFLQDVFYGKTLKNYEEERKNFTEDFQIYMVALSQPWGIKDLSLLKDIFGLFDDGVKVLSQLGTSTAMEYICEASVYAPQGDALAELAAAARTGDQDAIGALYEKTYSKVYYTVKSMIKDEDAVLDVVQDTYIKAFAHLDSFQGDMKFLPWVRQIAANTARNWLKKKRPMLFTELNSGDGQDTPVEEQFPDERSDNLPDQIIDQKETKRLIREIIEELPEDQRAVIGMFYYEEMSVKEIAAAMGVSESAVKSRLMYGRNKIEKKILELEKKGTKLYSLSPLPFLLLLFRSQKAYACEVPDGRILDAIFASRPAGSAAGTGAGTAGAGGAGNAGRNGGTVSAGGNGGTVSAGRNGGTVSAGGNGGAVSPAGNGGTISAAGNGAGC